MGPADGMLVVPVATGALRYGGPLRASRCACPAVRMLSGTPLDFEELQALSGTWSAHLNLEEDSAGRMQRSLGQPDEDGVRCLTLHLEARALEFGGHRTPLHTTDETVSAANPNQTLTLGLGLGLGLALFPFRLR